MLGRYQIVYCSAVQVHLPPVCLCLMVKTYMHMVSVALHSMQSTSNCPYLRQQSAVLHRKLLHISNRNVCVIICAGLTDFAATPSSSPSQAEYALQDPNLPCSSPSQAAYPLHDPNLPGSSHVAASQGASVSDVVQLHHAPIGAMNEHQPAMSDSHSGTHWRPTCALHIAVKSMWGRHGPLLPPLALHYTCTQRQRGGVCPVAFCSQHNTAQQLCFPHPHPLRHRIQIIDNKTCQTAV